MREALNTLIEDKNKQIAELQAFKDNWEPVVLFLPRVISKWERYNDRLSESEAELLRLYNKAKGAKASEGISNMGSNKDADGEPET